MTFRAIFPHVFWRARVKNADLARRSTGARAFAPSKLFCLFFLFLNSILRKNAKDFNQPLISED